MSSSRRLPLFCAFLFMAAVDVLATHEVDHRYEVRGVVLDAAQAPVTDSVVRITDATGTIGTGKTDSKGRYAVHLHLHDADLGRELEVSTAQGKGTIRVAVTPGDRTSRRLHHVSFIGGEMAEGERLNGGVPLWGYLGGGALLLAGGGALANRRARSVRKAERDMQEVPAKKPKKRNKRNKRNRKHV